MHERLAFTHIGRVGGEGCDRAGRCDDDVHRKLGVSGIRCIDADITRAETLRLRSAAIRVLKWLVVTMTGTRPATDRYHRRTSTRRGTTLMSTATTNTPPPAGGPVRDAVRAAVEPFTPEAVESVSDRTIPGPACDIPVRVYRAAGTGSGAPVPNVGKLLDEPKKWVSVFTAVDGDTMTVAWQVIVSGNLDNVDADAIKTPRKFDIKFLKKFMRM